MPKSNTLDSVVDKINRAIDKYYKLIDQGKELEAKQVAQKIKDLKKEAKTKFGVTWPGHTLKHNKFGFGESKDAQHDFKVGDKVKILPGNYEADLAGKIGVVQSLSFLGNEVIVGEIPGFIDDFQYVFKPCQLELFKDEDASFNALGAAPTGRLLRKSPAALKRLGKSFKGEHYMSRAAEFLKALNELEGQPIEVENPSDIPSPEAPSAEPEPSAPEAPAPEAPKEDQPVDAAKKDDEEPMDKEDTSNMTPELEALKAQFESELSAVEGEGKLPEWAANEESWNTAIEQSKALFDGSIKYAFVMFHYFVIQKAGLQTEK